MRRNNIDVLKAICAFFVVCIHTPFPGLVGEWFMIINRIAVPIFFIITGFFYNDVADRGGVCNQIKKMLYLMIKTNILFFIWDVVCAIINGELNYFFSELTIKSLIEFLLFNESPFAWHLWYIGAVLYVLVIVYFIDKLKLRKLLYIISPLLLLGDLVFGKYSILIMDKEFPYIIVRNFLFVGIPYFSTGLAIKEGFGNGLNKKTLMCFIAIFTLTSILEMIIIDGFDANAQRDHYISTTLLAASIFLFTLKTNNRNKYLSILGKKYSAGIYIFHPIFATALEVFSDKLGIKNIYDYVAPIIIYIITFGFLVIIYKVKIRMLE